MRERGEGSNTNRHWKDGYKRHGDSELSVWSVTHSDKSSFCDMMGQQSVAVHCAMESLLNIRIESYLDHTVKIEIKPGAFRLLYGPRRTLISVFLFKRHV